MTGRLRPSRIVVVAVLWLSLSSLRASIAHAEGDTKNDERVARELFKKGITAYNLGDYDRAIGDLKRAYELSSEPQLLFNIAQALRAKRDYGQALVFYRNYLRLVPSAPNRTDAESLAVEMQQKANDEEKAALEDKRRAESRHLEETRLNDEVKRADALRRVAEANEKAERERAAALLVQANLNVTQTPATKTPVYKKWWLWAAVGGVVVGVGLGVGLGLGLSQTKTVLPSGSLGTIDGRQP